MKVYAGLVCLAKENKSVKVLVDSNDKFPSWTLTDTTPESLELVKSGFFSITGIQNWPLYFNQSGVFEFLSNQKDIYIVYDLYLPAVCTLASNSYKWVDLFNLEGDKNNMSIIRYISTKRI